MCPTPATRWPHGSCPRHTPRDRSAFDFDLIGRLNAFFFLGGGVIIVVGGVMEINLTNRQPTVLYLRDIATKNMAILDDTSLPVPPVHRQGSALFLLHSKVEFDMTPWVVLSCPANDATTEPWAWETHRKDQWTKCTRTDMARPQKTILPTYVGLPAAIMSLSYSPLLAIVARLDGAKVVSVEESAFFLLCKHVSWVMSNVIVACDEPACIKYLLPWRQYDTLG